MLIYFSVADRDIKKEDFLKANFHFGKFIFVWPITKIILKNINLT